MSGIAVIKAIDNELPVFRFYSLLVALSLFFSILCFIEMMSPRRHRDICPIYHI